MTTMSSYRTFTTQFFSTIKKNATNIPKRQCLSKRFYMHQSKQFKPVVKHITKFCGTCMACGFSLYYLTDKLTVHAKDWTDEDKPPRKPYSFLADVVENAQPAVVYIEVTMRHPFGNAVIQSHGSGFIVREDGLILTNAHVIHRQTTVQVKLLDGRIFQGEVQVVDAVTDLATVKINAKNLPTLKLGKSSDSRPGEFVIAMGSPMNLNNSVTHGIISSVRRGSDELGMHNRDMEYIQTDAVITKGNSGGPLVNLNGEAIGINTLNMMSGISFAIPSDKAAEFLRKATELEKRASSKGWFGMKTLKKGRYIGITMFTLSPDFLTDLQARVSNFPKNITGGVLVQAVLIGSPAHRSGIQPGDVIVKVNGTDIKSSAEVFKLLENNDKLNVEVVRQDKRLTFIVKPDEID